MNRVTADSCVLTLLAAVVISGCGQSGRSDSEAEFRRERLRQLQQERHEMEMDHVNKMYEAGANGTEAMGLEAIR